MSFLEELKQAIESARIHHLPKDEQNGSQWMYFMGFQAAITMIKSDLALIESRHKDELH